ncbi:MAG: acyltransferase family protein [Promethearchaeota archaeon]
MKRFRSMDNLRGLALVWMITGHLGGGWLQPSDHWMIVVIRLFIDFLASPSFILVSGTSIAISYRVRLEKTKISNDYNKNILKNEYLLRSFCIFIIALIYNVGVVIQFRNITLIWTWFVLLTISISMFLIWPIINTPKIFRILLGGGIWIVHIFILSYLTPFKGQLTFNGILYHILYNELVLDPIMIFFTFFLVGSIIGESLFGIYQIEESDLRRHSLKNQLILPMIIIGILLMVIGIIYDFPNFLVLRTFPWALISMGEVLLLFAFLITIEEYEVIRTKKNWNPLIYFSYFSLTVYLSHYLLFFLFYHRLTVFTFWFFLIPTLIMIGVILRTLYKKWGKRYSLKYQIGYISLGWAKRIETKRSSN